MTSIEPLSIRTPLNSGHLRKQDTFICPKCHICVPKTSEMRTPHWPNDVQIREALYTITSPST